MNLTQAVNNTLKTLRRDVPEYVGSGVIDMSTGMLLAVDTVDSHPREVLDVLAAATADLFEGKTVTQIEEMWKTQRGVSDDKHYFHEILIYSENLVHLFIRSKVNGEMVTAVICSRNVNVGMLFAQARAAMRELHAA